MQLTRLLPRGLRHRIIRSRVRLDWAALEGVEVKIASTEAELRGAARIVHDSYVARGLMPPHPSGLRIVPQSVLPSTITGVAKLGDRVIGTMSVFGDSPLGLPLEEIYGEEVAALRQEGRVIGETGALAVAKEHRGTGVVHLLNRLMWQASARRMGIERIVIAIHPDAQDIYEATMLFERFGVARAYPGLNHSARAVFMVMNMATYEARAIGSRADGVFAPDPGMPHFLCADLDIPAIQAPSPQLRSPELYAHRAAIAAPLARARMDRFRALPTAHIGHLRSLVPDVLWPSRSEVDRRETAAWGRAAYSV